MIILKKKWNLSVLEIPEIIAEISKCYLREKERNVVCEFIIKIIMP